MRKRAICLLLAALLTLGAAAPALAAEGESFETEAPMETEMPLETEAPAGTEAPAETETPAETEAPAETETPAETEVPAETEAPAETEVPFETEPPLETETPAEIEAPEMEPESEAADEPVPAADRQTALWVYDPDWAIRDFRILGSEKPYGVIIGDGQTVPAGAVAQLELYKNHVLMVHGGTVEYVTGVTPAHADCSVVRIQLDPDAVQLNIQVYETEVGGLRRRVIYNDDYLNDEDKDGLIRYKEKLAYVPEDGAFPVFIKEGNRLQAEGGTLECLGASELVPGYVRYTVTADPSAKTVELTAVRGGFITLRIDDDSGRAVVRRTADTPGSGETVTDGETFSDVLSLEVLRPDGYMAVATVDCQVSGHRLADTFEGMYDLLRLTDGNGDGEATVAVMPTVEASLGLPEGYPDEDALPLIRYSVDGTWTDAWGYEVPAGGRTRIAVGRDYTLSPENAAVLRSWYEGERHWYELTAPESGMLRAEVAETAENPFQDISSADWFYESVLQACRAGVVKGMTDDTFVPKGTATRGQTVTMLHRLAGSPAPAGQAPFTDLTQEYYKAPVAWAAEADVVNGITGTTFAPDSYVTREQLAVMLYRMAGSPAVAGGALDRAKDGGDVDDYAREGMEWALAKGIMTGDTDGSLRPTGYATRAEVCTMLMRCRNAGSVWVPKEDNGQWVGALKSAQKADQLLIVAAEGTGADVAFYEKSEAGVWSRTFSVKGYVGADGIGKASERDQRTPVGKYGFTMAFGILDDPGCAISYTKLDDSQYWVDDPKSAYYNKFVSTKTVTKDWNSAEHLLAVGAAYNYVLALDYNKQCVPDKGSAIFLHCSTGGPTAGCVSIPEAQMKTVMERVKPGALIIIDTPEGVRSY